jgi:hypothetical protein
MSSPGSGVIKTVAHDKITTTASPIVTTRIIVASVHPPVFPLSRVQISSTKFKRITTAFAEHHLIASGPRLHKLTLGCGRDGPNEDTHGTHCAVSR